MKIQYGHVLTVSALCVAIHGSSVENVLAGMSNSQIEDILNNMGPLDYPWYNDGNRHDEYNKNYDYDYDMDTNRMSNDDQDLQDVNARGDVPKTEPAVSQGNNNPIHAANPMLPAYCDPPNPCPIGYKKSDGCIEGFENTSEFSRRFQATQNCICDTEHMFDCPEQNAHRGAEDIAAVNILEGIPGLMTASGDNNPYLDGQKLPVAAKKGNF